jgi:tripartite ATP-independent transporter DctM subunit
MAFDATLGLILITELILLFGNILSRAFFDRSYIGAEEIGGIALIALTFIGGAIAYRRGQHISVRLVVDRLPVRWRPFIHALESWLILALASFMGYMLVFSVFPTAWIERTMALGIRSTWTFVPFVIGMFLLALFALERLFRQPRRMIVVAGAIVLLCFASLVAIHTATGPWNGEVALWLAFVVFLLLLAVAVPIGFVLPMVSLLYLYGCKASPLEAVPVGMQNGVSGFVMLSIPFFILAGNLMTEGGLARPMATWIHSLVGHMRGGLLQVVVVFMFLFSGISGAKVADVAAVGTTMKKALEEQNYEPAETVSVLAVSAVMGETVPPSIAMLVISSISSVSVGALFVAGILPAIVIALCLMLLIYVRARTLGMQQSRRASWIERGKATVWAVPALVVPILLIVGIAGGFATPTEASSIAVVYALGLSFLVYRKMDLRAFRKTVAEAGSMSGMILLIIGAGAAFSWSLSIANVPHKIASLVIDRGGSPAAFLLATLVTMVLMGQVLEGLPALLTFGPMLMPIAIQLGIDALQYSIVLVLAMGLGGFSPPASYGFYISCSVGNATVEQATRRIYPYLLVVALGILIIAFVPWFSLVLPRMFHLTH